MPELLVRTLSNVPPLPAGGVAAAALYRAGDIISWGPDNFGWSFEERNSGIFVVIASSDMTMGQAAALCDPLPPDLTGATLPSIASHRFDLAQLPAIGTDGKYPMTSAAVLAAAVQNPYFTV